MLDKESVHIKYTFKYIILKIYPLSLRISSGSNLCKGTLTWILLPLSPRSMRLPIHFTTSPSYLVTFSLLFNCDLFESPDPGHGTNFVRGQDRIVGIYNFVVVSTSLVFLIYCSLCRRARIFIRRCF